MDEDPGREDHVVTRLSPFGDATPIEKATWEMWRIGQEHAEHPIQPPDGIEPLTPEQIEEVLNGRREPFTWSEGTVEGGDR